MATQADQRLSLLIELEDRPGALETALRVFSAHDPSEFAQCQQRLEGARVGAARA